MHVNRRRDLILYVLGITLAFLLICSKSSPFYPINDWYDTNDFVTLGKGILHGLVPYRDLYEQKGPILYFLHAIFYSLPGRGYTGVFVIEFISLAAFLYLAAKTILLYLPERSVYITLPILTALLLSAESFCQGGSAEELCAPMIMAALYSTFAYFRKTSPLPISAAALFVNGVLAGCIFWIKYTLLGFHLAFMAALFFLMVSRKKILHAIRSCIIFLGGMAAASVPVLVYFGINHSVGDLFRVYFYNNMFLYDPEKSSGGALLLVTILLRIGDTFLRNLQFSLFTIIGVLCVLFTDMFLEEKGGKAMVLAEAVCLAFFIYTGSNFPYYGYILCVFSVLGFIAIGMGISAIVDDAKEAPSRLTKFLRSRIPENLRLILAELIRRKTGRAFSLFGESEAPEDIYTPETPDPVMNWFSRILLCVVCLVFAFYKSPNTGDIFKPYSDTVQYEFAGIMNEEEDPTLLNYGFLDAGFYEAADILPTEKYFQMQNMSYESFPEMMDSQDRAVREQHTTFLILRGEEIPAWILDYYEVVADRRQVYERSNVSYHLLRKK